MRHVRGSFGAGQFPLDGSSEGRGGGRSPRREAEAAAACLADPLRVDRGRSGTGPGRHQQKAGLDWLESASRGDARLHRPGYDLPPAISNAGRAHRPPACAMPSIDRLLAYSNSVFPLMRED
ncbi:hypothetical protein NXC24_PB00477 (plasmid) [Rhizobium sp. NXC24]|nr:hypothetical protein NXC24_PB00477 [Rhizobium sp. NXC24]